MANIFPRSFNLSPLKVIFCLGVFGITLIVAVWYYATPKSLRVGYQPSQPIPFDHSIHVGQVGLDCRYCHSFVDESSHSNIPSANTCWNCHSHIKKESPKLEPLRRAMDKDYEFYDGKAIEWVRVHKSPDYVYFNHSAHVNRGVSCKSCHGNVDEMDVVYQAETHSMSFCLDCHRNPAAHLRPLEEVYNLDYDAADFIKKHPELGVSTQQELCEFLQKQWSIHPKESCSTCHR